ncbi:EstA family serine hydrolase [Pseudofrankia inefficax]|uniref:Beta-lactamase n=1 Tax=Pseudofrankia inefficax (strain DSM 45817 / CECT 9037 / DDB 130130 / EuI1c) TaxID=298654 RepID=E3IVP0_PSEI1|nr:EstA family serine hydrolase [Pseudofrankia inefficax]ADP82546.1 beta-lactamase [Pseudofrankia inefficax]
MAEVDGLCAPGFGPVRAALAELLATQDVGASAAVYVDGEPVVDLWGGYADEARTVPWRRDTIVNVFSTSKTITALCALMLADRGELDLDAPIARYWPEFAAAGKERVLVRHALAHTAGLPTLHAGRTAAYLYDWLAVTAQLAAQEPEWEPGTDAGYHGLTQGFLVGEVVRRVTGHTLGAFVAAEVAGPLGVDFHIGLPAELDARVAPVIPPPSDLAEQPDEAETEDESGGPRFHALDANTPAWRRAEIPAANGHGNARAVAAALSALACGGVSQGKRLLSAAGCARAWEQQFHGVDRVLGGPRARYGMGFRLEGSTCSWGGWGGSLALFDPDRRMAVAYAMNRMRDADTRGLEIITAVYESLG